MTEINAEARSAYLPAPHAILVFRKLPLHGVFVPFPIACLTLALLTDLAYWRTSDLMWQHFSAWLLFAGLVAGALALIVGVADFLLDRIRADTPALLFYAIGSVAVLLLALINSLVHAGDGWTAVVPYGLLLSALTVLLMIVVVGLTVQRSAVVTLEQRP